ncbi:mechanosensitive ion channel family protein [Affinibrenneria salicis]|uniref:Mechanosensitive ion channel family protein n=1 Tax=Affinibrenneria salicis TaxID=2590031 RepID=A0A5J5FYD6_9GAMM|nr:DUF3772 domain-containing protein [Affinibrenneria salicis]KAA8998963.1 mechanosensitive ion channel family protein [Affinibrenneria salicis]
MGKAGNAFIGFFYLLLALCAVSLSLSPVQAESLSQQAQSAPSASEQASSLADLQKQLDALKQQISSAQSDSQLVNLSQLNQTLLADADTLRASLYEQQATITTQLNVLGPAQDNAVVQETREVVARRNNLTRQKEQIEKQIEHASAIYSNAESLAVQISNLRRNNLKTQLALNSGSMLDVDFWRPLVSPVAQDQQKISRFAQQALQGWSSAWQPDWRLGSAVFLLLAVGCLYTRRHLENALAHMCITLLPEGRLRRSGYATGILCITMLSWSIAGSLVGYTFSRAPDVSDAFASFVDDWERLCRFSAMLAGLGRAFLSNQRPSWRLSNMASPLAEALRSFPPLIAGIVLLFGSLEQLNSAAGTSVSASVVVSALSALSIALTAGIITRRSNQIRKQMIARGERTESRSTLAGLMHLATILTALAVLFSLLFGYISLARFLTYEFVWVGLVLSCLYLFIHLWNDICESAFDQNNRCGKSIQETLRLHERHLAQIATLLSATGKTVLILFALVALLNGTFGSTTPLQLLQKAVEIWGGDGLGKLNIVPANLLNALVILVVGIYLLRTARRWLEQEFLPKTMMDKGMRVSLTTLFANIGYVSIALATLSTLGVQWNNLAWIVSALSVGIGFGLQEIVKNFISGIILLTERPVKVGDLVSISGIEGDIRRINVRATEIQLTDRSTVIVPNSQFISQNVRNATMGNAQGVVTIPLTFPLDIDPEQVRDLLLTIYRENESVLEAPAPSVTFSQLSAQGIMLSVTGYVASPRVVSNTRSDLLFEILRALRVANIALSSPQKMIIEKEAPEA